MALSAYPDHPAYAKDDPMQRVWHEFLRECLDNVPNAILHLRASQTLQISWWKVDEVATRARYLLKSIPPAVLKIPVDVSDRDAFRYAINFCILILALASEHDDDDLARIARVLQTGWHALGERNRGFEEPFFRVRPRGPKQPRESLYVRKVKAISAEACEALIRFGIKDAANKVAAVLNRHDFLPHKVNGKAVVGRSVQKWRHRLRSGELRFTWPYEKEGSLFPIAHRMWRDGQIEAAGRRVLRFLPRYLAAERRSIMGI